MNFRLRDIHIHVLRYNGPCRKGAWSGIGTGSLIGTGLRIDAALFTFNPYLLISINELLISIIHLLISINELLISINELLISINEL